MDLTLLIAALVALLALFAGCGIGWLLWGRSLAQQQAQAQAERDRLQTAQKELEGRVSGLDASLRDRDEKIGRMAPELATMSERAARADALAGQLDKAREDLSRLNAERAGFEEQKRLLEESRGNLLKEFENTGARVLSKAQEKFAADAAERFGQAEKANKEAVANLLKPVGDRLLKYEEQVGSLERQRTDAFAKLHQQIETMRAGQEEVRREAQRLGNSLTNAPKARGRWGERALQNLLEQCGLAQHTDFTLEHSLETDEGRMRPDAVVNVPGQKKLVIDSKVSLNAYQAAFEADDDTERKRHLDLHAKSMRNHVQTLGAKSYQSQFEDAPDYVVMFVPGEHFIAAALEADPELWDFAFEKKVLLASPTNLVAIARTVAQVWRQDALANEAREIGRIGTELYGRLEVAAQHLKRVGGGLETAVNNYNKFVGSFERNVLTSARRMQEKGIEIGKREIDEVPLVEAAPRYTSADVAEVVKNEEPDAPRLVGNGESEGEPAAS